MSAVSLSRSSFGRAAIVSILIGSSVSILTVGLAYRLEPLLGQRPTPETTVVAAALLLIALGIKIPHQFAMWLSLSAWRRFAYQRSTKLLRKAKPSFAIPVSAPVDLRHVDSSRNWVLLAAVSLMAGVSTAFTPIAAHGVTAAYWWLQDHFVWSLAPLVLLRALAVVATGLVPLTMFGLAISAAHRVNCRFDRKWSFALRRSFAVTWDTRASAWLLVGTAVGLWFAATFGLGERSADLCLTAAALPALAACLVAATASGFSPSAEASLSAGALPHQGQRSKPPRSGPDGVKGPRSSTPDIRHSTANAGLPLWSDSRPRLLRASIVAVSAVGAWVICFRSRWSEGEPLAHIELAGMLAMFGFGIHLGCASRVNKVRSIGGFGIACCIAGIALAGQLAMASPPAQAGVASAASVIPVWNGWAGGGLMLRAMGGVGLGAVGFALAYGRQSLLIRVATQSSAGSIMLVRVLVACALVVWVGAPAAAHLLSHRTAQAASALFLLALGGTLIVHEPASSLRTRMVRVGAVFCVIAIMICLAVYSRN